MSFDYAGMADTAAELLAEFGGPGVLKQITAGAYDPAAGGATNTTTSTDITLAVFDYPQRFVDGSLVKTGDKQAYISAVGVPTPVPGNKITWQDKDYSVVSVKSIAPAGLAVIHEAQIRS